jgi:hypothetical protein
MLRDLRRDPDFRTIIDSSVRVLVERVRSDHQHFAFIARERNAGPPAVRAEIDREIGLFERELATDLGHFPGTGDWSDDDLRALSNLIVNAMVATAEAVLETAPGSPAERRITDCAQAEDPLAALRQRARDYAAGDTDLAWTRLTNWRTLVAGALDQTDVTAVREAQVATPAADASGALLTGWLGSRLGITPTVVEPRTGGLESVRLVLSDGDEISIVRQDGSALVHRTGREPRAMPLLERTLGEALAEELRRLGPDQTYAAALATATGVTDLENRPETRVHTWVDPAALDPSDTTLVM